MNRQLKIVAWNANGVHQRKNELLYFLSDFDIDVALISETRLQPQHTFNLPGFTTYRTDRPARHRRNPGGGTMVLVNRRLVHREHDVTLNSIEATGVFVHAEGLEILVFAAYLAPNAVFDRADFDTLFNAQGPIVVAGDLNAKHRSWNSRNLNRKGRALREYLDEKVDIAVIAPAVPTFLPNQRNSVPDVIDIVLHRDLPFPAEVEAVNDLSSDHSPVLLSIDTAPTRTLPFGTAAMRTDWREFRQLLDERLTDPRDPADAAELDEHIDDFHSLITMAVSDSSRPVPPRAPRTGLPQHIRREIRRRNELRLRWRRIRHPEAKRQLNRQNRMIKQLVDDYRAETWDQYLMTLNVEGGSVWKAAKQLRGKKAAVRPLRGRDGLVHTAEDKAETFADTMYSQFQKNHDIYDDRTEQRVVHFMENFFSDPPEDRMEPFTELEVLAAIRSLKPRKAPGLDRIGAKALQSAPPKIVLFLLTMFNSVLRLCHFPASWKSAKVILIPKPGKDHLIPENFRPISLLPVISKMFERLFLSRISPHLEGFIRPEQFGFRRGHSTTQQLIRVLNSLVDTHNIGLCSVAVLLDVSKAFDKVWHEGLLYKLGRSPIPDSAVHLLRSYLTNRFFQIAVEGKLSERRPVEAGVPQGSVLGPVLYLIYTNDMPTVPGVTLSLYADDALLQCRNVRPARAAGLMQWQMDTLSPWLTKWRIKVNANKSNAICFRKRRKMPRAPPPAVRLGGVPIPWTPAVKYLGVTLDSGLCFRQHAERKIAEAIQILGLIGPIIHARNPLPLRTKISVFLLIVRSCMLYASEAWWSLVSKTNRKRLETIQSKVLRRITRQPWFVRNSTIRASAGVPTLHEFTKLKSMRLFQKAEESQFAHIRELSRRPANAENWRPRPAAILDEPP